MVQRFENRGNRGFSLMETLDVAAIPVIPMILLSLSAEHSGGIWTAENGRNRRNVITNLHMTEKSAAGFCLGQTKVDATNSYSAISYSGQKKGRTVFELAEVQTGSNNADFTRAIL